MSLPPYRIPPVLDLCRGVEARAREQARAGEQTRADEQARACEQPARTGRVPVRLLLVPTDARPCTRGYLLDLAAATGWPVESPPAEWLGYRREPGDAQRLQAWAAERATDGAALVASSEMLLYGGLIPSRLGRESLSEIERRIDRLAALATAGADLYLAAVNLRIPLSTDGGEEPDYWPAHGAALHRYSVARDRRDLGEGHDAELIAALAEIPPAVLEDFLWRRRRNLLANLHLVTLTAAGRARMLLVGQDDTAPRGLTRAEMDATQALAARVDVEGRVHLTSGADELCLRLLARLVNDRLEARPRVRVRFTFPDDRRLVPRYEAQPLEDTVHGHLRAAGAEVVDANEDLLLLVHNFSGPAQKEAHDQAPGAEDAVLSTVSRLADARVRSIPAAVADVRYANGADDQLVRHLLRHPEALGIVAYSAWNTCSNTLGTVIADATIALHVRRGRLGAPDAGAILRRFLIQRFVEDWGYQAIVRKALMQDVLPHTGCAYGDIAGEEGRFEEEARARFEADVLPAVRAAFGPVEIARLWFPWQRLFEVGLEVA
ncbi:MAG: DUF4127 family protein [Armatimonadetes bacterium]|nr:DUF4127 family protein [Armatimonadota bacterium]